jgi:AraC-like DNA-binding protein
MPCPYGLILSKVPAKKWETRADLLGRMEITRQILESPLGLEMTVDELARLAMVSRSHFIRLFTRIYGATPMRHRSDWRLDQARLAILQGVSVSEAAIQVGYSSLPSFSREFKVKFGVSPSQIRNRG